MRDPRIALIVRRVRRRGVGFNWRDHDVDVRVLSGPGTWWPTEPRAHRRHALATRASRMRTTARCNQGRSTVNPKTLKTLSDRIQSGAFEPHVTVVCAPAADTNQTYTVVVNDRASTPTGVVVTTTPASPANQHLDELACLTQEMGGYE